MEDKTEEINKVKRKKFIIFGQDSILIVITLEIIILGTIVHILQSLWRMK